MSLAERIIKDTTAFLNTGHFAESISVSDGNGITRSIKAIVVRNAPAVLSQNNLTPLLQIYVANDPVAGFSSAIIDTGKATATVARRIGEAPRSFGVRFAPEKDVMDPGMLKLELR